MNIDAEILKAQVIQEAKEMCQDKSTDYIEGFEDASNLLNNCLAELLKIYFGRGVCASGGTQGQHEWRDNCWTCAPFWWDVPYCPHCGKKLTQTGYCKECRKHYEISNT